LGYQTAAQMDDLGSVAEELSKLSDQWWGDPGLGQAPHAQWFDEVGGVALVVFTRRWPL
jgi:hypothetical protein